MPAEQLRRQHDQGCGDDHADRSPEQQRDTGECGDDQTREHSVGEGFGAVSDLYSTIQQPIAPLTAPRTAISASALIVVPFESGSIIRIDHQWALSESSS